MSDIPEQVEDLKTLEAIKLREEIKQLRKSPWKNPTMYTIALSAVSIAITGLIGYYSMVIKENEALETQRAETESIIEQLEAKQAEFNKSKQEFMQELLSSRVDSLRLSWFQQNFENLSLQLKNQGILDDNQDLSQQVLTAKNELDQLAENIEQNQNKNDSLEKKLAKGERDLLDQQTKNQKLSDSFKKIGFEKAQQETIATLFKLKSDLVYLITPTDQTFSGKSLNFISSINIHKPDDDVESIRLVNSTLDTLQKKVNAPCFESLSSHEQKLRELITTFMQDKFKSNRYIHNSRIFLGLMNPAIDTLLSEVNQLRPCEAVITRE